MRSLGLEAIEELAQRISCGCGRHPIQTQVRLTPEPGPAPSWCCLGAGHSLWLPQCPIWSLHSPHSLPALSLHLLLEAPHRPAPDPHPQPCKVSASPDCLLHPPGLITEPPGTSARREPSVGDDGSTSAWCSELRRAHVRICHFYLLQTAPPSNPIAVPSSLKRL